MTFVDLFEFCNRKASKLRSINSRTNHSIFRWFLPLHWLFFGSFMLCLIYFVSFLSLVVPVRQPLPPSFYHVYHETKDVASVVLFVNWLECFRDIWAVLETKETLLLVPQDSCCKIIWDWPFTLKGAMSRRNVFFFRRHRNHIFLFSNLIKTRWTVI